MISLFCFPVSTLMSLGHRTVFGLFERYVACCYIFLLDLEVFICSLCFIVINFWFVTKVSCCASQKKLIGNLVKIQSDGTVEVDIEKSEPVATELLELQSFEDLAVTERFFSECKKSIPRLQIVILVVGTRGDVQPFLAIAKRLQACLNVSL